LLNENPNSEKKVILNYHFYQTLPEGFFVLLFFETKRSFVTIGFETGVLSDFNWDNC